MSVPLVNGVTGSCWLPHRYWELNRCPLKEWSVFFSTAYPLSLVCEAGSWYVDRAGLEPRVPSASASQAGIKGMHQLSHVESGRLSTSS